MNETDRQRDALETLKAFNNAVVTVRLYPAMTPQVTNAVERGYKSLKLFLRHYGDLVISLQDKKPMLRGELLPDHVLQSLTNLVVYRHLEVLGLDILVLKSGIDRHAFGQLLFMFTSRVEKIKREGGGREFSRSLDLEEYFPEEYQFADETEEQQDLFQPPAIREEYAACLSGGAWKQPVADQLRAEMADPDNAAVLLAAAVMAPLQDLQRQKEIGVVPAFSRTLKNAGELLDVGNRQAVAAKLADALSQGLQDATMGLVLAQTYPDGFGTDFYDALLGRIDNEFFGKVIGYLRRQSASMSGKGGGAASRLQLVNATLAKLLNSARGRQFLGQEKARNIMESGERERQAKRISTGLRGLLQGNLSGLQSDELVMGLPAAVQQLIADGHEQEVLSLLVLLNKELREGDAAMQARIIRSLAIIGEHLVVENRWDLLSKTVESMLNWFRKAEEGDFTFEKVAGILHAFMEQAWKRGNTAAGDRILEVFYQIRAGIVRKSPPVQALVGRVQDREVDRSALPGMLKQCLEDPTNEPLGRRLIMQGMVAVRFLVEELLRMENADDRIKTIDLLTYSGQMLLPVVRERLSEPMPWHGKRNLIKLLSEVGTEQDIGLVMPYLMYDDLRVQREAFVCLYKISGTKRKEVLMRIAAESGEVMRTDAVKALSPYCDAEVAAILGELLDEHEHFSDAVRDTLLVQVCSVLGRCPHVPAIEALEKFLQLKGKRAGRKIGDDVWAAAGEAMAQLEAAQKEERRRQLQEARLKVDGTAKAEQPAARMAEERAAITGLAEELTARTLLGQGKKDAARRIILELIVRTSRIRRFDQAEKLRAWMIEVDPMALSDIIQAAEIIDEEKKASIDKSHLDVWSNLYQLLTPDEFTNLYHLLEHRRYENDELIVSQGSSQAFLFFINSGKVKLFYRDGGRDALIKNLSSGEVLGAGVFFDASVWTFSASSLGHSDISLLSLNDLKRLQDDYPAVESKLNDFCRKFEKIDSFFRQSGRDRRRHQRFKASGRIAIIFLDGSGSGVRARGELADVSVGGVSLFMRFSKKDSSRMLLGRSVSILLSGGELGEEGTGIPGIVSAVKGYHAIENDYSVHVKFDESLAEDELQRILQRFGDSGAAGSRPSR
jgi:hypothetical protein